MPEQRKAIIGAGINVIRPESGACEVAAYLSDFLSASTDLLEIVYQALEEILACYHVWQAAEYAFVPFKDEYNSFLALINQDITVSNGNAEIIATGTVQGVDDNGYLVLEKENGQITRISGGEVTLRVELP